MNHEDGDFEVEDCPHPFVDEIERDRYVVWSECRVCSALFLRHSAKFEENEV